MNILLKPIRTLLIIFLTLMSISACSRPRPYQKEEGMIWNTVYHITYQSDRQLGDSILITLESVGKSLSVFDPNSLVSTVNKKAAPE